MFVALAWIVSVQSMPVMAVQAEEKVCRRLEVTGSLIPKRVCRSKSEWEEIDKRNRELAERYRDANRD